jgi:hypothetical protein
MPGNKRVIAVCSCGEEWHKRPDKAGKTEVCDLVFWTWECPRCHSGVTSVANKAGDLSTDETCLAIYAASGVTI